MKLNKMILQCLSLTSISMISLSAFAGYGFYIGNNTNFLASVKANNGDCSTKILGDSGLFKARTLSGFNDTTVAQFCGSSVNCMIDIYMTKDCSGSSAVTVTFDQKTGIVSLNTKDPGFTITKQAERTVGISQAPAPSTTPTTSTTSTTPTPTPTK